MDKELTLLICCHNHGKYLPSMLSSVFTQTLDQSRWKLLIIFDECTDDSKGYFNEGWKSQCLRWGCRPTDWLEHSYLIREKKEGLAACKNFGLKHIDTPYVAYLDADDGMFPERLERQLNFLNKYTMKQMAVCACQVWDRGEHGGLFINCFEIGQYQYHHQIEERIPYENIICHGSTMARTEAIMDVGGYSESQNILGREDWDLWQRMIIAGKKFYTLPERLYIWSMGTSTER